MIEIDSTAHTVTFIFDTVPAERVFLVGDFNDWNESSHPMLKEGDLCRLTLSLPPGEYEFKYLVDRVWFNDREAHRFVPNPWGSENSVIVVGYR